MAATIANTTAPARSPCCPEGALPALLNVDYEPQGERFELAAVPTRSFTCQVYVTGASHKDDDGSWGGRPILIMWCDSFGPFSGTHRKLADEFARQTNGIVLLPDPFCGDGGLCPKYQDEQDKPQQLGFNRFTWDIVTSFLCGFNSFLKKYPWETNHLPLIKDQLLPFLPKMGVDKFAMLGFCYGSWLTLKSCNDETIASHVTCGLHYHPSSELMEKAFEGDDIALCHDCHRPQLIHATKNESAKWKPDGAAHEALKNNQNVSEIQFSLAPDSQSHGFMTRVDIVNNEVGRKAVQDGIDMALSFLKKYNQPV